MWRRPDLSRQAHERWLCCIRGRIGSSRVDPETSSRGRPRRAQTRPTRRSRHDTPDVGGPCANRQRVGSDVNAACGDNDDSTEDQVAKGGGGRFSRRCDHFNQRPGNEVAYPRFCVVQGDYGLGFRQPRRTNHRALFSFSFFKLLENACISGEQVSSIRHNGSDGERYFENITMPMVCVGSGGQVARTRSPEFQKFLSETKPADELGSLNELFDDVERNR